MDPLLLDPPVVYTSSSRFGRHAIMGHTQTASRLGRPHDISGIPKSARPPSIRGRRRPCPSGRGGIKTTGFGSNKGRGLNVEHVFPAST